jgi:hypothetical protein
MMIAISASPALAKTTSQIGERVRQAEAHTLFRGKLDTARNITGSKKY